MAADRPASVAPIGPFARRAHLFLAMLVGAALLLRLGLTIFAPDPILVPGPTGTDPGLGTRLVRFVSYFTVESNLAVVLASVAVLRGADLAAPWMRALRLASLVGITVTGIIFAVVLSGDPADRSTLSAVANVLLHYVAPPLTVVIWLAVGPWPGLRWSDIPRVLVWAVVWGGWILLLGAITDWYPYGFVDVYTHGYGKVLVNFVGIVLFASLLGALFVLTDRWRGRSARAGQA